MSIRSLDFMTPFDFHLRTRFVFGPDRIDELGSLAAELGAKRALVVSDPGIVAAGHAERGQVSLAKSGIEVDLFDGAKENPTTVEVEAGLAVAREFQPDLLVGLGGGSSMDCAKGINFLYSCGGRMHDYWGEGKATGPMLPSIAVPTTAGTGSEAQSFALISDPTTHVKMACGDKRAAFRVAILDPKLTLTQPPRVTALTGIDAISHAVETYVTTRRNDSSIRFSSMSWSILDKRFPRVLEKPDDLEARGDVQLAAFFAGLAIENSMLGATHALANPLTATFGIAHGEAIGLMLPHVVRFNGQDAKCNAWYRYLVEYLEEDGEVSAHLADYLAELVAMAGLAGRISECGVPREVLPKLAADAARQWTGTFNPRPVDEASLLKLYELAY